MDFKKFGKCFLYPHWAIILILLPLSAVFLTFSLINFDSSSIVAIISYLLAFYTLLVVCFRIPQMVAFFKRMKNENKYAKKWFSDVNFRMKVGLYATFFWNGAYAIFQLGLGFYFKSMWFYTMSVYYLLLSLMRFFLADYARIYNVNEKPEQEAKKSLLCGCMLLFMNLALGVIVTFIVLQNKTFNHGVIVTISLATYTFVTFTLAIINSVRYRKYKSLVFSSAKSISLITGAVSMLTLESTMLSTFGENSSPLFNKIVLSCSGVVVVGFAIVMAIIIIVNACKQYRKYQAENMNEEIQS